MKIFAIAMLATALAGSAPSIAGDQPTNPASKPTSFVPHARTNRHVYGTPIEPPIVGHAKRSHRKRATKHP